MPAMNSKEVEAIVQIVGEDKVSAMLAQMQQTLEKAVDKTAAKTNEAQQAHIALNEKIVAGVEKIRAHIDGIGASWAAATVGANAMLQLGGQLIGVVSQIGAAMREVASAQARAAHFQKVFGEEGKAVLDDMDERTGGRTTGRVQKAFMQRMKNLGESNADIAQSFEMVMKVSQATGRTVEEVTEVFAKAMRTGKTAKLAEIGVHVDLKKAVDDYAKSIGLTVDQLSAATKKSIEFQAVNKAGRAEFAEQNLKEGDLAMLDRSATAWANLWKNVKMAGAGATVAVVKSGEAIGHAALVAGAAIDNQLTGRTINAANIINSTLADLQKLTDSVEGKESIRRAELAKAADDLAKATAKLREDTIQGIEATRQSAAAEADRQEIIAAAMRSAGSLSGEIEALTKHQQALTVAQRDALAPAEDEYRLHKLQEQQVYNHARALWEVAKAHHDDKMATEQWNEMLRLSGKEIPPVVKSGKELYESMMKQREATAAMHMELGAYLQTLTKMPGAQKLAAQEFKAADAAMKGKTGGGGGGSRKKKTEEEHDFSVDESGSILTLELMYIEALERQKKAKTKEQKKQTAQEVDDLASRLALAGHHRRMAEQAVQIAAEMADNKAKYLEGLKKAAEIDAKAAADKAAAEKQQKAFKKAMSDADKQIAADAQSSFDNAVSAAGSFGNRWASALGQSMSIIQKEAKRLSKIWDEVAKSNKTADKAMLESVPTTLAASGQLLAGFVDDTRIKAALLATMEVAAAFAAFALPGGQVSGAMHLAAAAQYGVAAAMAGGSAPSGGSPTSASSFGGGSSSDTSPAYRPPQVGRDPRTIANGGAPTIINIHMAGATIVGSDSEAERQLAEMVRRAQRFGTGRRAA